MRVATQSLDEAKHVGHGTRHVLDVGIDGELRAKRVLVVEDDFWLCRGAPADVQVGAPAHRLLAGCADGVRTGELNLGKVRDSLPGEITPGSAVCRRVDDDGNAHADQRRRRLNDRAVDQVELVRRRRTPGDEGAGELARLQKGDALATRLQDARPPVARWWSCRFPGGR